MFFFSKGKAGLSLGKGSIGSMDKLYYALESSSFSLSFLLLGVINLGVQIRGVYYK